MFYELAPTGNYLCVVPGLALFFFRGLIIKLRVIFIMVFNDRRFKSLHNGRFHFN